MGLFSTLIKIMLNQENNNIFCLYRGKPSRDGDGDSNRVAFNNFLFWSALLLAGGLTSYNNKMCILKRIRRILPSPPLTSFLVANALVLPLSHLAQDFLAQVSKLRIATKPGLGLSTPSLPINPVFRGPSQKQC